MRALFDPVLMAQANDPFGSGALGSPCRRVSVENPMCGDGVELDIRLSDRIDALAHRVRGCVLVAASASLMARNVTGRDTAAAADLDDALRRWLGGDGPLPPVFAALGSARAFPARRRCVLLPWDALSRALAP